MRLPFRCAVVLLLIAGGPGSTAGAEEAAAAARELALDGELTPGWTQADEDLLVPVWLGDEARGALVSPMFRGAAAGIEDYVFTPPDGDCANARGVFRIDWDEQANTVRYQLKFKQVPVRPEVRRTEGVDFFPNPFHRRAQGLQERRLSLLDHLRLGGGQRLLLRRRHPALRGQPVGLPARPAGWDDPGLHPGDRAAEQPS